VGSFARGSQVAVLLACVLTAVSGCSGSADPVLDSFASPTAASAGGATGASGAVTTSSPATPTPTPTATPPLPAVPGAVVLAAVGDINHAGEASPKSASGRVAASITAASPNYVLGLGDYQYTVGTCAALTGGFDKLWGGLLPRMFPIAGPTHDWTGVTNEQGYRQYFAGTCPGQTTGPSALVRARGASVGPGDFWSRDIGTWHLVGLPTALWRYAPDHARAMTATLSTDLAKARARGKHLLVAYHDPYFTSTTDRHARYPDVKPWVDVLDRYDVRITLSASQHNYERTCPVLSTGACTPNAGQGTTSFNVSTGGLGLRPFRSSPPYIAKRFADSHGWLALSLHPDGSFAWHYQAVDGTGADAGARPAFPAAAH
jgi:acid phosphatase type 7